MFGISVLYTLVVMRLTKLINSDTILDGFRAWVVGRARDDDRSTVERRRWATFSDFLGCPWCVGLWISVILAFPTAWFLGWTMWLAVPMGLACSYLTGLAAQLHTAEEIDYETVEESPDK